MRRTERGWPDPAPCPGAWTILARADPVMDLHLQLMTEAAEEALRGARRFDEVAARRRAAGARR